MTRADKDLKAAWQASLPIGRFIDPVEIGELAAFVVEQRALTGANIVMDGGWTITAA
jgi:NAD(P)-dependent dehydrogenase (short-subunit alcohol dehydrogenase family)